MTTNRANVCGHSTSEVDAVVLVVTQGSPLRDIADARDRIELSGTPIVGYIFNRATSRDASYHYTVESR